MPLMMVRKVCAHFVKFSIRDYGFCSATLLLFTVASLVYQLNGGPPGLQELRKYLGNSSFLDGYRPLPPKVLPFPSQVVYNRVGKCGSRTVVQLLKILTERNHFNLVNSDIHNKTRLNKNEQAELVRYINIVQQPYLYTRHVHFLNFTRFGLQQPVYINLIRDPISRFVSNYFFRRFGDWRSEQNHQIRTPGMKDEERYLDISDCILENHAECSNPRLFYIIPYFCGQHPKCRDPGEWALQRAKDNMNENYLLVGILEELEDVLLLLERLLPHYFKDASSIYHSPEYKKLGNGTITVKKQIPSPKALQVLYQQLQYEYDFYRYVRDQFHLLKRKFGLKVEEKTQKREYVISELNQIPKPNIDDNGGDGEGGDGNGDDGDNKWLKNIYR
uniref:Uronyl 2-sulfotransferase n=1 Tax=Callorhinchus milii TaxID=7868 RepID=A0A4W3HRG7_CALMI